jgi:hypothetical protein
MLIALVEDFLPPQDTPEAKYSSFTIALAVDLSPSFQENGNQVQHEIHSHILCGSCRRNCSDHFRLCFGFVPRRVWLRHLAH